MKDQYELRQKSKTVIARCAMQSDPRQTENSTRRKVETK